MRRNYHFLLLLVNFFIDHVFELLMGNCPINLGFNGRISFTVECFRGFGCDFVELRRKGLEGDVVQLNLWFLLGWGQNREAKLLKCLKAKAKQRNSDKIFKKESKTQSQFHHGSQVNEKFHHFHNLTQKTLIFHAWNFYEKLEKSLKWNRI